MKTPSTVAVRAAEAVRVAPADRRRAFTLMELMVVIAIILVLIGILLPTIQGVQEGARRAKCAANLNGIGKALTMYSGARSGLPYVPLNGMGWGVAIGTNREVNPFDGAPNGRSVTSNLYLLVRARQATAKMFVCPSVRAKTPDVGDSDTSWDFASGANISYAVQNPYGKERRLSDDVGGGVVLLADASPYFDAATGLPNGESPMSLAGQSTDDSIAKGNSPNHQRRGQNVALPSGSTEFQDRPDCGMNGDNIYTRAASGKKADPAGTLPSAAANGNGEDQGPSGDYDSWLLP